MRNLVDNVAPSPTATRRWGVLLLALAFAGCAATPDSKLRTSERLLREGKADEASQVIDEVIQEAPENVAARILRASILFDRAQKALAEDDEATYLENLEEAQNEALTAVELDPEAHQAHNLLGIIAAYRADLDGARQSFRIASKLSPRNPIYHLNLAELAVYLGNFSRARREIALARKLGAPPGEIELVEVLAAWRRGDYVEARDTFDDVALLEPERARTWNGATSIETFEDMAAHCCKIEFCGPYMEGACRDMDQRVAERKRAVETRRRELEMKADRERRVGEVYRDRRDILVETEPEEPEGQE